MSEPDDPKGRILRFRPRGGLPLRRYFRRPGIVPAHQPGASPIEDLAKYERTDDSDDYRHRMVMNGLAVLVVAFLIGVGVWIATTMADLRKNQDCVLQGRKNCTPIDTPRPNRW
jgi:hypothetical protein